MANKIVNTKVIEKLQRQIRTIKKSPACYNMQNNDVDYSQVTLLVDLDDTMTDLLSAWLNWLNNQYSTNVRKEDITDYDITKFFPSVSHDKIYAPLYNGRFWASVRPKKDAPLTLLKLKNMGFRIYVCTSSSHKTIPHKVELVLKRYFGFIPCSNIITTTNKQLIKGDILIDDAVHNLVGGSYQKILMTAPHNQEYDASKNDMIRVNNWTEAFNAVIECSKKVLNFNK